MLPIYICEDDPLMLHALTEEINRQIMIQEYDMEVVLATVDPELVLQNASQSKQRSLYFLDVDLNHKELDGFSLGSRLRSCDARCYIVYVTSHMDLAFKTFEYHLEAMDYIPKGNQLRMIKSIRNCLACLVHRLAEEPHYSDDEVFTVCEGSTVKMIPLKDILFFETSPKKHRIILYTDCERIEFTGSLQEISEKITEGFLRTHRSYLVNTEKIKEINYNSRELTLTSGQTCLFSRSMRHQIQRTI